MQQLMCKMVWSFSFYSLKKSPNFKRSPGGKILKKCEKCGKVRRGVKNCQSDFAL